MQNQLWDKVLLYYISKKNLNRLFLLNKHNDLFDILDIFLIKLDKNFNIFYKYIKNYGKLTEYFKL